MHFLDFFFEKIRVSFLLIFDFLIFKSILCSHCFESMNWNEHKVSNLCTTSFGLKEQLNEISKFINIPLVEDTIELIITLDGIPLSDSSDTSLYPVVLYIYNIREDKKLMDSLALYKSFSICNSSNKNSNPTKLNKDYDLMLQSLLDEYEELKLGFKTNWSDRTKIKLKMFIGDAPCRHDVCNFLRYNGVYPCLRCYIVFEKDQNAQKKLFPLTLSSQLKLRTHKEVLECIQKLNQSERSKNWFGVKGPSPLLKIDDFDLIQDVVVDVMHAVFLGVYRFMINLCFSDTTLKCYLNDEKIKMIDNRLEQLDAPSSFQRKLRSIREHKNYKSVEWQNHLLYCHYFIYKNIIPNEFVVHLMLLSSAIFKLWSANSTEEQINQAKFQIDLFLVFLQRLGYNETVHRYNCHILVHLAEDRKRFGPLKYINQYSLEGQLQVYKSFLSSNNKRVETLARKASLQFSVNLREVNNNQKELFLKNQLFFLDELHSRFLMQSYSDEFRNLVFYEKCNFRSFNLTSKYAKNKANSFVKIYDGYYSIILFFEIKNVKKVFAERIEIKKKLTLKVDGTSPQYDFTVDQINLIDHQANTTFFIYNCDEIQRKVFFVKLIENPNQHYLVDVEN